MLQFNSEFCKFLKPPDTHKNTKHWLFRPRINNTGNIPNELNEKKRREERMKSGMETWRARSHWTPCLITRCLRVSRDQSRSEGIPYLPPRIPKCKLPAHQGLDIFWAKKKIHTRSTAPGCYASKHMFRQISFPLKRLCPPLNPQASHTTEARLSPLWAQCWKAAKLNIKKKATLGIPWRSSG